MSGRIASFVGHTAMVIAVLLAVQTAAAADAPRQYWRYTDFTFRTAGASAVCGFDVFMHIEGRGHAILFFDKSVTLVSEIDSQPDLKVTIFAPSTGMSFMWSYAGALIQYYADGGAVGSSVTAIVTGVDQHYPAGVNAGRTVYEAVVAEIDEDGIPIIDFGDVISESGADLGTSVAVARCDAVR